MNHALETTQPSWRSAPGSASTACEFGPIRIDVARHLVTRDGRPVSLAPKTFDLLVMFVRSGGRALSRRELMAALWPDTLVEEANLSFQVSALRKALGNGAEQWVETVPKVGYRFTAEVEAVPSSTPHPLQPRGVPGVTLPPAAVDDRPTRAGAQRAIWHWTAAAAMACAVGAAEYLGRGPRTSGRRRR